MVVEEPADETHSSPGVGGALSATLLDLEPDSLVLRLPRITATVRAAGHVGQDRTHMGLGPESPLEVNSRSGLGLGVQSSGLASLDTTGSVAVALKIDQADVLDRTVSGDRSRDTLGGRAYVRVGVGVVEFVRLAADGGGLNVAVGSRQGRGEEDGDEVTHVESG